MKQHDILILGGGVGGLATAWHLGRQGSQRVLLLERESTLGAMASAQNAAILRTFTTDLVTTEIARASAAFLGRPPIGFSPVPLIDPVGLLLFATGATADAMRAAWQQAGPCAGAREIPSEEAARLAPHLGAALTHEHSLCLHFPEEGQIDVAAMLDAFANGARAMRVEMQTDAEVDHLLVEGGRVAGVQLADGTRHLAHTTVIAAGGWAGPLGAAAGSSVSLRPTRRHLLVTAPDASIDPKLPIAWSEDGGFYCRPESRGMLLSGCDLTDVDPSTCTDDSDVKALIAAKTARYLPQLEDAPVAHFWHGIRTLTHDDRFALGRDPDVEGLFWVAGLGGHGMTCGAEVGRMAAALLNDKPKEVAAHVRQAMDPARLSAACGA